ncbi:hypothetical protein [Variovorax soli]|uniref:Tir chaperone protein (CesT) family protein n=1 Tax=Variovorax soli TaxID=376815 RepID=A0ABU1N920_9BURK|nr:hypothetical protein [Variovorax soli]MDR6534933.1 hypothetical protein [Variovorax soli]
MTVELGPGIDRYLASVRLAPAVVDIDGSLFFQVEERLQIHAAMLPDERVELFAGAGYVRAELLQAIVEADEDDDFDEDEPRHVQDVLARWTGEGAHWAVDVHRQTGLLTLSMVVSALPGDPSEWAIVIDAFMRTADSWTARLEREAAGPWAHSGVGLTEISSGAFLRC